MQGKLLTAAIALVLIGSLAGCNNSTAAKYDYNGGLGSSSRSAMERNGVHDGTAGLTQNGQDLFEDTPNWNDPLNATSRKGIINPTIIPG